MKLWDSAGDSYDHYWYKRKLSFNENKKESTFEAKKCRAVMDRTVVSVHWRPYLRHRDRNVDLFPVAGLDSHSRRAQHYNHARRVRMQWDNVSCGKACFEHTDIGIN